MGGRGWLFVALLGAGGCRQIFGIELPGLRDAGDAGVDALVDSAPGCYGHVNEDVVCFSLRPSGSIMLGSATTIDTDTSSLCSTNVTLAPRGCVLAGDEVHVQAQLRAIGSKPLIIVANNVIVISTGATVDVASHVGGASGAGANASDCRAATAATAGGGGAGGSFGGVGGQGGDDHDSVGKGIPAPSFVPTTIEGGCAGASGSIPIGAGGIGGAGGGSILLITSTLQIDGAINASGAGGIAGPAGADTHGAGGGGSGGMIAIDALVINGDGRLLANGGGGGGGSSAAVTGSNGQDPNPTTVAPGGGGGAGGGTGGAGTGHNGGNAFLSPQNGLGGGGGGGGTGVIQYFYSTMFTTGTSSPS